MLPHGGVGAPSLRAEQCDSLGQDGEHALPSRPCLVCLYLRAASSVGLGCAHELLRGHHLGRVGREQEPTRAANPLCPSASLGPFGPV